MVIEAIIPGGLDFFKAGGARDDTILGDSFGTNGDGTGRAMSDPQVIRLATRRSALALIQAGQVAERLSALGLQCALVEITTKGDRDRRSLGEIGGRGVFTKALEEAIITGRADAAVHSAKDLPTGLPSGLVLAAALEREDPRDAFVSADGVKLAGLPAGSSIGTSSPRRAAALLALRRDLVIEPIRGNVPTRLAKVEKGDYAGAVFALAGLKRLALEKSVTEVLETDIMLPAAGQGAIVVETKADGALRGVFESINHGASFSRVLAERAVLRSLRAGCRTAVGALAVVGEGGFVLRAEIMAADGSRRWCAEVKFIRGEEGAAGARLAAKLIEDGAGAALEK